MVYYVNRCPKCDGSMEWREETFFLSLTCINCSFNWTKVIPEREPKPLKVNSE